MTAEDFVKQALVKATGKVNNTLTPSDNKYQKMLAIGNYYIRAWESEPDVDWNSLYDPSYSIGEVTASDSFDLDDDIRKISDTPEDEVKVVTSEGQTLRYQTVSSDELPRFNNGRYVAQIGRTIRFNKAFNSDAQGFGGDLQLPVYTYAPLMETQTDEVPVDNPLWLVTISAAEYVRNDVVRQNQYPNLISEANNLMQRMKEDNGAQVNQPAYQWHAEGSDW